MAGTTDDWFKCKIDRSVFKGLTARNDRAGIIQAGKFFSLIFVTGWLAYLSLGTVFAIPAFLLYGTVFAFSEAAAHELGHGTPFKSRWINELVYWVICFMSWREQVYSRWLHSKHHTYTHLTASAPADPELALARPPNLFKLITDFIRLSHGIQFLGAILFHSFGIITKKARAVVPETEFSRMCWNSRVLLLAYASVFAWAYHAHSWLPVLFLFLPRSFGTWLHDLCALTQHVGLRENVLDHRVSSRTVMLNPLVQFLYWNMNYHVEHHMFPNVPFHTLPKLRTAIEDQMPAAYKGLWHAWFEIIPTIMRQRKDPNYMVEPIVPGRTPNSDAYSLRTNRTVAA